MPVPSHQCLSSSFFFHSPYKISMPELYSLHGLGGKEPQKCNAIYKGNACCHCSAYQHAWVTYMGRGRGMPMGTRLSRSQDGMPKGTQGGGQDARWTATNIAVLQEMQCLPQRDRAIHSAGESDAAGDSAEQHGAEKMPTRHTGNQIQLQCAAWAYAEWTCPPNRRAQSTQHSPPPGPAPP